MSATTVLNSADSASSAMSEPARSSSPGPVLRRQTIERPFVDRSKLIQKLRTRYGTTEDGKNNFKVQLRLNRYTILVPETEERLSEHEINEFCYMRS